MNRNDGLLDGIEDDPALETTLLVALLLFEAAAFFGGALVHVGALLGQGYSHSHAATAETVLALVLVAGAALTWSMPAGRRTVALAAQSIALAGTLVGAFTIAIDIGPRTPLDLVYHAGVLLLLAAGLAATLARRSE